MLAQKLAGTIRHPSRPGALASSLYRGFSGLETDLGMLPVTEGLVHGRAAAAESDSLFAADVVFITVGVRELQLA